MGWSTVNGLPGKGPWIILEACFAPVHNTLNAGRGRKGKISCTCPRTLELKAKRAAYERAHRIVYKPIRDVRLAHDRASDPHIAPQSSARVSGYVPDFGTGLCHTTSYGQAIARGGMTDKKSLAAIEKRQLAKEQCGRCPLLARCEAWVTQQEAPAGSWGGVWGARDAWERKGVRLTIEGGKAITRKLETAP